MGDGRPESSSSSSETESAQLGVHVATQLTRAMRGSVAALVSHLELMRDEKGYGRYKLTISDLSAYMKLDQV